MAWKGDRGCRCRKREVVHVSCMHSTNLQKRNDDFVARRKLGRKNRWAVKRGGRIDGRIDRAMFGAGAAGETLVIFKLQAFTNEITQMENLNDTSKHISTWLIERFRFSII